MRKKIKKEYLQLGIVAWISIVIFLLLYGIDIINPTYDAWLLRDINADRYQSYLGWKAFRTSDWTFPIGLYRALSFPYYQSIIFTDSIPLFAILFKILSPILPETFQYFGLWGLCCFILQGTISAKLISKYSNNMMIIIFGSILMLLSPIMLRRMFDHNALAGQWIILLSITAFIFYKEYFFKQSRGIYFWAFIASIASLIHLYFLAMCGILLLGYMLYDFLHNESWKRIFSYLFIYLLSAIVTVFILGGLSVKVLESASIAGLGFFSFNLNGLINPMDWSVFLKNLPIYAEGQYDGFGYLGLGIIILILCSFYCRFQSFKLYELQRYKKELITVLLISVITIFFSISNSISFGNKLLLYIPLPDILEKIWGIFRCTGRIMWVLIYILVLSAIIIDVNKEKSYLKVGLLIFCLIIQVYDIHSILLTIHNQYVLKIEKNCLLDDEIWQEVALEQEIQHIVLASDFNNGEKMLFGNYAIDYGKDINDSYFARNCNKEMIEQNIKETLNKGEKSYIYIVFEADRKKIDVEGMNYYYTNKYIIGSFSDYDNWLSMEELKEVICPITQYEEGKKIFFASDNRNCEKYVLNGISNNEMSFAWTNGNVLEIRFTLDKNLRETDARKINAYFDVKKVYNEMQQISVLVNNKTVYYTILHDGDNLEFEFDIPEDNNIEMEIQFPDAISPKEMGISEDKRKLAIALFSAEFNYTE